MVYQVTQLSILPAAWRASIFPHRRHPPRSSVSMIADLGGVKWFRFALLDA